MKFELLSICLLSSFFLSAQTIPARKAITDNYNIKKLESIKLRAEEMSQKRQQKVQIASEKNGWPIKVYENGMLVKQAMDVNEQGEPIYTVIYNRDAAISTRTNYVNSGGGLGLNLDGDNMLIGIWDGGLVLDTHIEFADGPFGTTSRVTRKDSGPADYHGTHVAGTMIARGSDPQAKGMASKADMVSYDWEDDRAEVIGEIQQNGLLISNHSYGVPVFKDNGSMNVDPAIPGKYTSFSYNWDLVHYNAPKYLMVIAAGNEGELSYPQSLGPNRDKLTNEGTSKNNLVVANAMDAQIDGQGNLINVQIHPSSSQGPTDDRRIKPDITGNGTHLYSTSNASNTAYAYATGTSMASPNVAGSLILLQQYYHNLHNTFMRSATLKGIALHTADDAGTVGPDAVFGWGLLNVKKAAETITGDNQTDPNDKTAIVKELTLNQGGTYTISVDASTTEPLKASITWTDIPGNPANNQLNSSTPVLVNDLDIRITQNSNTFLPWKLSFFDPVGPAIQGDNTVDNVERVDVENATGTYTITVTHKGSLQTGSQDYSLVITGLDGAGTSGVNEFNSSQIAIWPNPVNNTLNINLDNANGSAEYAMELYDLQGRSIMTKEFDAIDNENQQIDTSKLQPGMYILKLSNGATSISKKIIKN